MTNLVYLVPLFPLIGFLINGLGWRKIPKTAGGVIGSLAILASFCVSLGIFFEVKSTGASTVVNLFDFIQSGKLYIPFAFQVDSLSSLFLLIITGIGFLIHLYSTSYMHDDEGMVKYFAYLNLFVFSMLLLVLGANYLVMFIGWEGVGLCSYLLIGFWFKNRDYTNAAKKAFVMNRIGDLGFLVGMLLILLNYGTLSYQQFFGQLSSGQVAVPGALYNTIAICLFVGAMGKSAQIPLYTWLPDAMAGPTPVSALIHAATMVTAGIYMIARSAALYDLAPIAQNLVAVIGLATALLAATIALYQNDIKKVLAYSTVSQLGYMFLALGVGAYTTGIFHVMTHAFFKALLFLGAGSVIHAMGGEQDIKYMGGLRKKLPITFITFLVGVLAISGFPFTSGFVSKDEILLAALQHNKIYFWVGTFTAVLTAIYMFRLLMLVFFGSFRGTENQKHHLHESPWQMTLPLIVLAILSLVGGFVQLPELFGGHDYLNQFLAKSGVPALVHEEGGSMVTSEYYLFGGTVIGLAIIIFATFKSFAVDKFEGQYTGLKKFFADKWYIDELYDAVIVRPLEGLSKILDKYVERMGIDGIVNGVGKTVRWGSDRVRLIQTGQVGFYIFAMVIGITILFALSFFWIR
ncbi:MAG: NADH-quinone oxidoreductase subunit L [Bacteroidetes bacterium 43-93]|nr:NADH-quinone oxidoreductase subunit L [Bacteroidota bacterium]OJW96183.1 MAG: NADH-quinone oxidoreductase subunit L [Bacteroidetes bacterium 43-93]